MLEWVVALALLALLFLAARRVFLQRLFDAPSTSFRRLLFFKLPLRFALAPTLRAAEDESRRVSFSWRADQFLFSRYLALVRKGRLVRASGEQVPLNYISSSMNDALLFPHAENFLRLIDVLLTHVPRQFGFFGSVHVSNRTVIRKAAFTRFRGDNVTLLDGSISTLSSQTTRSGRVYRLLSSLQCQGESVPVWESQSDFMFFGRGDPNADRPPRLTDGDWSTITSSGTIEEFDIEFHRTDGREMAHITGDVNPIHLSEVTAWAFGFPGGVVIPGMLVQARALCALALDSNETQWTHSCTFRKPVYPGKVHIVACRRPDGAVVFEVRDQTQVLQYGWAAPGDYSKLNPF